MQSSTDRRRRIGRHGILWLAGPIVLIVHPGSGELAPPTQCAAVLDLLAIGIVRRWPELPIGQLLAWVQPIVLVLALGCIVEWFYRLTRSIAAALAIGVLIGFSPAFGHFLALPARAAAVGACATVALTVWRATIDVRRSFRSVARAAAMLLIAALVVPPWTAACAVAAGVLAWSRGRRLTSRRRRIALAVAFAAVVAAVPILVLRLGHVPALGRGAAWYACAVPTTNALIWLRRASPQVWWTLGPIVLALGALGLSVQLSRVGSTRLLAVAGFVALASVPVSSMPPQIVLAPLMVATWSAAAIGLDEVFGMMRRSRGGFVVVVLLLGVLPILEIARVAAEERDNAVRPNGQERASLAAITSILNLVPSRTLLVEEDATIDLLLRASLVGGRRSTKPFAVIPADREDIARGIKESIVWAFPLGQKLLALRGFEIKHDDEVPVRGLARVAAARPCQELGTSWVDLSAEGRHGRIAIAADSEASSGPVVLYFGGPTEYVPGPEGWAPRVRAGFEVRLFDRSTAADAARLDAEARELHLDGQAVFQAPFVSRIYIRRTPLSPLELPVVLGPPTTAGVGRLREDASPSDRLSVCDAPPSTVSTF